MKLHAHKFFGEFSDGSKCVARLRKSRRLDVNWIRMPKTHGVTRRPSPEFLTEYRSWRARMLETLFPGKTHLVIES